MSDDRFRHLMKPVALKLLGEPNKALSSKTEWRFGSHGSLNIDVENGIVYDHEIEDGQGVLWLIEKQTGRKGPAAIEWLRQNGFAIEEKELDKDPTGRPPQRRAQSASQPARAGGTRPSDARVLHPPRDVQRARVAAHDQPAPQGDPRAGERPADGDVPARPPTGKWAFLKLPADAELVARYSYVDENGKLLFQVCRFEYTDARTGKRTKTFRQRRPDGDRWNWSAKDVRQVPYRLPEVLEAIASGHTIFVVEGEKDVDNLWNIGVPATCNAGGAGKFPPELVEFFAGADVVTLPDNDLQKLNNLKEPLWHDNGEPILAGQDHAKVVADAIAPVAHRVRVLELARHVTLPPKGDVSDWIEAGGTADMLYGLLPAAVDAALYVPSEHFKLSNYQPRFSRWKSWKQIGTNATPHEWIIKNIISVGELSMLAGAPQSGKSFLTIEMCMAICRGTAFFGHKVVRPGGVIYQAGEGGPGLESLRLPAYVKAHGISFEDDLPFELLANPINLWEGDADTDALIEDILWKMRTMPVPLRLIVIDTLAKAMPGANENASQDVSRALARCDRIRLATGANVMLVHHMNAAGERARGWGGLGGNVETTLITRKLDGQSDREGRTLREMEVEKLKDGVKSRPIRFVLRGVFLGRDQEGEAVSSCVVKPPGETLPEGTSIEEHEQPGYVVNAMDVGF